MALWTRRTSTCGRPVSQVIERSASLSASRWTLSISLTSSRVVDRGLGLLALLGERRREALDQLARDADDDLRGPEAGHLLGLLERDRAVVDDRGDVRDRARLHVRQALAPATDAAHGPVAGLVDLEDERLGELRPDVQRRAGGRDGPFVAVPDAAQERHLGRSSRGTGDGSHAPPARSATAARTAAIASPSPSRRVPLPWAISGRPPPRPSICVTARLDERAGGDAARDEVVADGDEQLRLVRVEAERDHAAGQRATDVLGEALERVDGLEVQHRAHEARRRARGPRRLRGEVRRASGRRPPPRRP